MMKIFLILVALFAISFACAQTTYYVDDDGVCGGNIPCSTTIAGGLASAVSGDTVYVYDGSYTENPTVNAGINLSGESNTGTVVSGTITIYANTVVNNLKITGSGKGINVPAGNYDNQVISNNLLVQNIGNAIETGSDSGTNMRVSNNLISDNAGSGFRASFDPGTIYFEHNTIVNNSDGVVIGRRSNFWLTDNIIAFNRNYAFANSGGHNQVCNFYNNHSLIYANREGLLRPNSSTRYSVFYDVEGGVYSQPRFVDSYNGDYRIDCGSPAASAATDGTNIGVYQGCVNTGNYYGPFYVAKTGDDSTGDGSPSTPYLTIQRGIDQALYFDEVIVKPGTYTENPVVDQTVALTGAGNSDSIVSGTITMSHDTNLTGFKVTGNGQGLYFTGDRQFVEDCRIESNTGAGIATASDAGTHAVISRTLIANNGGHAVDFSFDVSDDIYFTHVTIVGNSGNVFDIIRRISIKLTDSIVANNGGYLIGGSLDYRPPGALPFEIIVNNSLIYEDPIKADSRIEYIEVEGVINDSDPLFLVGSVDYELQASSPAQQAASDGTDMGWIESLSDQGGDDIPEMSQTIVLIIALVVIMSMAFMKKR